MFVADALIEAEFNTNPNTLKDAEWVHKLVMAQYIENRRLRKLAELIMR